jgi:hypothetical protein
MRLPALVYVAGPYSAPTPEEVQANVDRAIDAGNRLMDAGFRVRVPHLSHYQHARKPRPYRTWMEIDFADLSECDVLLRLPGTSSGADEEVEVARRHGIPVYTSEERLLLLAQLDAASVRSGEREIPT